MDRHQVGAGVAELLHIPARLHDHQVNIQGQRRGGADGFHHRDTDGNVGDEHAVHHIHMDVIGGGDALDIPLQIGKIRGEDGRCDFYHGKPLFSFIPAADRTESGCRALWRGKNPAHRIPRAAGRPPVCTSAQRPPLGGAPPLF